MTGVSIGAINAALIAGNPAETAASSVCGRSGTRIIEHTRHRARPVATPSVSKLNRRECRARQPPSVSPGFLHPAHAACAVRLGRYAAGR